MRIFAQICLLGLCLGVAAQETTSKSSTNQGGAEEASKIVKQLFSGMKSPSPVTPPLVESIEKELKKEVGTWNPTSEGKSRADVRMVPVSKVDQKLFAASANRSNTNPPEVKPVVEVKEPAIPKGKVEVRGELNREGDESVMSSSEVGVEEARHASATASEEHPPVSPQRTRPVAEPAGKNKPFVRLFSKSNSAPKSKPGPLFKGNGGLFKKLRAKKASKEVSLDK